MPNEQQISEESAVFYLNVAVFKNSMDFFTHASARNGWEETLKATKRVRAELDRTITEGSEKCPYAPKVSALNC